MERTSFVVSAHVQHWHVNRGIDMCVDGMAHIARSECLVSDVHVVFTSF